VNKFIIGRGERRAGRRQYAVAISHRSGDQVVVDALREPLT
jgi:hypothetical protein